MKCVRCEDAEGTRTEWLNKDGEMETIRLRGTPVTICDVCHDAYMRLRQIEQRLMALGLPYDDINQLLISMIQQAADAEPSAN